MISKTQKYEKMLEEYTEKNARRPPFPKRRPLVIRGELSQLLVWRYVG